MPYRAMALVAASVLMLSGSALAQKIEPTPDSKNLNTSRSNVDRIDGAFHQPGGQAAKTTVVKGGKSNSSDRASGGVTTVNRGKSNTSDRMGAGGGGKGAVQLNPQPEPPGSKAK
jgi:hypothetical protein